MPAKPMQTEAITSAQFKAVAAAIIEMATALNEVSDVADRQPEKMLAVYNWPSAQLALEKMAAFVDDSKRAKTLAEIGTPRQPGLLKPRSTAREHNDAKIKRSMDKAKQKLNEMREQDKKKKDL